MCTSLSLDDQKNKYRALDDWFKTSQGTFVQVAMTEQISSIKDKLRGTTLLQLGMCGENTWLDDLPFRRKWLLTPCLGNLNASVVTSLTHLPFDRNSVDCVIAPLTLEAFGRDKNPIHEIDRILRPMGHIIFLGINPLSLWGLLLRMGYLDCFGRMQASLTSSLVLKQTLLNRGYRQCVLEMFYYIPPIQSSFFIDKLMFLNQMGKMIAPGPAGFYCLIVQKYQYASPNLVGRRNISRISIPQPAVGLANAQYRYRAK